MLEQPNETILLERAASGDSDAFSQVYERFAAAMYRHAYFRVSDKALAEDIMADIFLKTWEYIAAGKRVDNLKSFLYRVANNLIIDHYRRKNRQPIPMDEDLERVLDDGRNPIEPIDRRLDADAVAAAMKHLRADYREVVAMRYFDDLSYDEIAELTGRSKNAVYISAHRGLKELVKIMEKISV